MALGLLLKQNQATFVKDPSIMVNWDISINISAKKNGGLKF